MASVRPGAYLGRMAIFPRPVSPWRAIRDLRVFLAQRERHELIFAFLSVFITVMLIVGFYIDSQVEKPWKRNIQYVESWPLSRSDAEIVAQQKIDMVKKKAAMAKFEAERQKRMKSFQRLDKQMDDLGL